MNFSQLDAIPSSIIHEAIFGFIKLVLIGKYGESLDDIVNHLIDFDIGQEFKSLEFTTEVNDDRKKGFGSFGLKP